MTTDMVQSNTTDHTPQNTEGDVVEQSHRSNTTQGMTWKCRRGTWHLLTSAVWTVRDKRE